MNQPCGHWLLSDVLNYVISMIQKLRDVLNIFASLHNLMEVDPIIVDELTSFASNLRKEVCVVLEFFLCFLRKFEGNETHNMFLKILNPRLKSLRLVSLFIGRKQSVAIVEEYDKKPLYPMLLKCHHHLHPLIETKSFFY